MFGLAAPIIQKHMPDRLVQQRADSLGPTQQAGYSGRGRKTAQARWTGGGAVWVLPAPSAYALQMLGNGIGDSVLTSTLGSTPTLGQWRNISVCFGFQG